MKRLTELEPHEVSMVKKGANKKKFLVLKRHGKLDRDQLSKIVDAEPGAMAKVDKVIKDFNMGFQDEESEVGEGVEKDDLTAEGRKHIATSNFAIPKERKYPIHDLAHARNALARVSQHGTPEEKAKVRAAVHRKYPNLAKPEKAYEKVTVSPSEEGKGQSPKANDLGPDDSSEKGFNEPFSDEDIAAIVKGAGCYGGQMVSKTSISQDQDEQQGPLDEQAQATLKAVARILSAQKGKISPMVVHQVVDAAGYAMLHADPTDGGDMAYKAASNRQSPEPISEEHKIEAMKVAKEAGAKAYGEHLEKLGYRKYPDAEMAQKAVDTDPDEPAQDEEQEGTMHNPDAKEEGKTTMHKKVSKSAIDVSKLPREVQAFYKDHQNLVEKSDRQERELTALRMREAKKELVSKAQTDFPDVGSSDEIADQLLAIREVSPELATKVEKVFKAAQERISKGDLFSEFGTSHTGHGATTWDKIEQAAMARVAKSGEKSSREQAVTDFLETNEGRKMYSQYKADKDAAGRR